MPAGDSWKTWLPERKELNHVVLVTVATVTSLLIARMFRLPGRVLFCPDIVPEPIGFINAARGRGKAALSRAQGQCRGAGNGVGCPSEIG